MDYCEYKVELLWDPETKQFTAEVPTLGIADYGSTVEETLQSVRDMIVFHIECLIEEGEVVPEELEGGEGTYVRVRRPLAHAA